MMMMMMMNMMLCIVPDKYVSDTWYNVVRSI